MPKPSELSVTTTTGLASIVIPCCGMLEYTKLCVPSILRHTRPPYELIFLDIGSLDGTSEYLAGLQTGLSSQIRVEVVRCQTDLGVSEACKTALQQSLGEYVVLLNNDTIVTNGWLNQLVGLSSFSMTVGMVGPMSNMAAPPQLVETVPYRTFANLRNGALVDTSAVDRFADKHRSDNMGNWVYAERLNGFCLLVKRELMDKIGNDLDQWTDLRLFDSDILSAKAKQQGYSLAVCRDLFVHHFGTRTFAHAATAPAASVA